MTTEYGIFDKDMKVLQDGFASKTLAEATAAFDYQGEEVVVAELCGCGTTARAIGLPYCTDCDLEEDKVFKYKSLPTDDYDDPCYDPYDPFYDDPYD